MATTISSVPAVMDKLVSLCQTLPGAGNTLTVLDGIPYGTSIPQRMVLVGSIDAQSAQGTNEWSSVGGKRREENYTVALNVLVAIGGTNQAAARDDCFSIYQALDTLIVGDPTLGGLLTFPANLVGFELTESTALEGSSGRFAHLLLTLQIKNRISSP